MGVKIFLSKIFWDLRHDGGHNEGVGAGSCHSGGETQKRNDGKFPPPKAKGKTRDKVAAYEGVSGRTLGEGDGPGGKVRPGPGHFDVRGGGSLPCPAPEPKPPSVSHSGFASSGPLRRTPFPHRPLLHWVSPFRGRGGAVSGSVRRRFIFPGGRSGGAFQVAGVPGGRGRPGEGRRHRVTSGRITSFRVSPLSSIFIPPIC